MTNLSDQTRKQQVLAFLQRNRRWVDGPEIANAVVGGSEGHRRLRELRADGYRIIQRRHPDPKRDIWQYLLVEAEGARPLATHPVSRDYQPPRPPAQASSVGPSEAEHTPVKGQTEAFDLGDARLSVYTHAPSKIEIGSTVICPRCHGRRKPERVTKKGTVLPADDQCYDPEFPKKPCHRCGGLGLVPNVGPVP